jgi:hypothetical protein
MCVNEQQGDGEQKAKSELGQSAIFLAVARAGTLSAAAEELSPNFGDGLKD